MEKQKKIDILLYSKVLKRRIKERFEELNLKPAEVVRQANSEGMTAITKAKLSKYLNSESPIRGFPTQLDILWLATRYCINVRLKIQKEEYNEQDGIKNARQILESTK